MSDQKSNGEKILNFLMSACLVCDGEDYMYPYPGSDMDDADSWTELSDNGEALTLIYTGKHSDTAYTFSKKDLESATINAHLVNIGGTEFTTYKMVTHS